MDVVTLLKAAKNKIVDHGWGQYALFRLSNIDGEKRYDWDNPAKNSYDILGALMDTVREAGEDFLGSGTAVAENYLCRVIRYPTLSVWNDEYGRTEEDVLKAFDAAIEQAEQDQKGVQNGQGA